MDKTGKVLEEYKAPQSPIFGKKVLPEGVSYIISDILADVGQVFLASLVIPFLIYCPLNLRPPKKYKIFENLLSSALKGFHNPHYLVPINPIFDGLSFGLKFIRVCIQNCSVTPLE